MSPRWASRRVGRGPRWYCQTGGCNVMRQTCPSDWSMLEWMIQQGCGREILFCSFFRFLFPDTIFRFGYLTIWELGSSA
jgi:hypothetical protein